MIAEELSFKNLPFVPVEGQVIYAEPSYNKKWNDFIRTNYEWVRTVFRKRNLEFCYLPLLIDEVVNYNAPFLKESERRKIVESVPALHSFAEEADLKGPALLFGYESQVKDSSGFIVLQMLYVKTLWLESKKHVLLKLANEISRLYAAHSKPQKTVEDGKGEIRFVRVKEPPVIAEKENAEKVDDGGIRFMRVHSDIDADSEFDVQSLQLVNEIKERIMALRNRGVNTMFLHDIIDHGERLSRLHITDDFRIFLVDYNNMEIKMPFLPKSVFLLFLHHPEGIRFKNLSDYYSELLGIYLKMNPIGGRSRHEQSIREVTNPCSNSINEKCARIREAFVKCFDDRLAKHYYVTGKKGEAKRIMLDESLILWDK
jgi:hypothetical protein